MASGAVIEAKNRLVYFWPQWLPIVPDSFLSGRAAMRVPLSDLCTVTKRSFSLNSMGSVRALPFLRALRVLSG